MHWQSWCALEFECVLNAENKNTEFLRNMKFKNPIISFITCISPCSSQPPKKKIVTFKKKKYISTHISFPLKPSLYISNLHLSFWKMYTQQKTKISWVSFHGSVVLLRTNYKHMYAIQKTSRVISETMYII